MKKEPLTTVRRSQMITTYGIGSLIPVEQESFIVLGQDSWPEKWLTDKDDGYFKNEIVSDRFAQALGVENLFVPPSDSFYKLPVKRFPLYYLCSRCNRLDYWSNIATSKSNGQSTKICAYCKDESAILRPSRFVAVCPDGHIQEFPYFSWVHRGEEVSCDPSKNKLRLFSESSDDSLRGLIVRCTCGASRSMEGALGRTKIGKCQGKYPWLYRPSDRCSRDLIGLQRGATSVWQSIVESSITVPEVISNDPIQQFVDDHIGVLQRLGGDLDDYLSMKALKENLDFELLKASANRALQRESDEALAELRDREYAALQQEFRDDGGANEFLCYPQPVTVPTTQETKISGVSAVPRLREIRALTGFFRVEPSKDDHKKPARLLSSRPENWLPAIEAWGEGIFLRIDEDMLSAWERQEWPEQRLFRIQNASRTTIAGTATVRQILLHSLSHVLINQLALQAGYTASSIRERVYSKPGQSGVLLYTAGTDSAGSLGGLAALGTLEKLQSILLGALETARWCTADPVCIESGVRGLDSLNLAACHYCMFVPEVSCEHNNVLLDRALLIGTPEDPAMGFFSDLF
ncbi:DUF1998 domain-containing protein [Corynebacterium sp. Marseille-P4321]|uniref:DUF1998 domain-containing protein n=1 Tax=Corynebacterium sp. Marseille-P4321 TaxID=2736603 RepID=UPI00158E02EE|nr:DUF1998 domain-containing protein [Corynebacterium sp. Marseille-P4321]